MTKERFLITGGSGFLGINLIRYLLKKGAKVRSFDLAPFDYPEKTQVETVLGDIRDPKAIDLATGNIDIVIHCAAALPLYSKEDIYSTEVEGTRVVLESSLKHKVDRVIFISSTAVYGVPDHHPVLETDKLVGVGSYGEAKIEAEKVCLEFRSKGLCIPILRPKSFVGPERLGVFALLYDWASSGKNFPIIGEGLNKYQLLDVEDLCQAVYLACQKDKKIVNDTFNIGAKKFTTIKGDFQSVLSRAGYDKKIISLPTLPIILALKILEALRLSPLYGWIYETVNKDSFVSILKAEKVLGFKPKFSNSEALLRNYEWYLKNLEVIKNSSGISHRVPWKQGILSLAKIFF